MTRSRRESSTRAEMKRKCLIETLNMRNLSLAEPVDCSADNANQEVGKKLGYSGRYRYEVAGDDVDVVVVEKRATDALN